MKLSLVEHIIEAFASQLVLQVRHTTTKALASAGGSDDSSNLDYMIMNKGSSQIVLKALACSSRNSLNTWRVWQFRVMWFYSLQISQTFCTSSIAFIGSSFLLKKLSSFLLSVINLAGIIFFLTKLDDFATGCRSKFGLTPLFWLQVKTYYFLYFSCTHNPFLYILGFWKQ